MANAGDVQILVEFPEPEGVMEASILPRSREEWAQVSEEALGRAMATIENMAGRVAGLKERIGEDFKEVSVEFGVKLDVETGAIIAKTHVEASLQVTLKWARE